MRVRPVMGVIWVGLFALVGPASVLAADAPKGPAIGEVAPVWKDLPGVDGETHSLADLKDSKAVAVVFFANHCPDCKNYLARILALSNEFKEKEVEFVLISVSTIADDNIEHMKKTATEHKFPFHYIRDETQKIGKEFGAANTPEIFILDGDRKLAYRGAIDDHWKAEKVETRYAKNALDAVLAGKKPDPAVTEAEGCFIEYEER